MPWKPSFENPLLNSRLDPYRHRAAEFHTVAGEIGTIYVQPELMSMTLRGHLWWREWERAREHVILWIEDPGVGPTDTWIMTDDLDDEIDHWKRERFPWLGEVCQLRWLDDEASRKLRQDLDIDETDSSSGSNGTVRPSS